ncbi:MAG: hypothetical protein JXB62_13950 [Pirellulales bacterium]|nr:hypothetical protein [Pirellulales bacterium]
MRRLIAGVVVLVAVAAVARTAELCLSPIPQKGVLLLRNGQTIEGQIARAGDLYYVALPNGEIRVKTADVEFSCRDIEEGYRRKRAAVPSGSAHDHLRLARWCLQHDLPGHAARELADAFQADPNHPMIPILERRLTLAVQKPVDRPKETRPPDPTPQPEDLERMTRGMPPGSVEEFTQTIQPLLVNHCAAAACHGPGTTAEYKLLRMPVGHPPSRLLTQRNLHATLQWIDRDRPAANRLLEAALHPHGTSKAPIFTSQQTDQYRRIAQWVAQVAAQPAADVPATVSTREKPPVRAMTSDKPGSLIPDRAARPMAEPQGRLKPSVKDPFGKTFPVHADAPGSDFVPLDPFDPEIFNRQFFPAR